jgi:hypothetical protein
MTEVFVVRDSRHVSLDGDREAASRDRRIVTDSLKVLRELTAAGEYVRSIESLFEDRDLIEMDRFSESLAREWHTCCATGAGDEASGWLAHLAEFHLLNYLVAPVVKTSLLVSRIIQEWNPERIYYDSRILQLGRVVAGLPKEERLRFAPLSGCGEDPAAGDSLRTASSGSVLSVAKALLSGVGKVRRKVSGAPSAKGILLVTDSNTEGLWQSYESCPNVYTTSLTLPRTRKLAVALLVSGRALSLPAIDVFAPHCRRGPELTADRRRFTFRGVDVFPMLRSELERVTETLIPYWRRVAEAVEGWILDRNIGVVVVPSDAPPLQRLLVNVANRLNVPTLVVQHGLKEYPVDGSDMSAARYAAVWGEWVKIERTARYKQLSKVFLVGATALDSYVEGPADAVKAVDRKAATVLILPQSFYRMSSFSDAMHDDIFLDIVLQVLASRSEIREVIVKPHPGVRSGHIENIVRELPIPAQNVSVCHGPLRPFLRGRADIVICGNSTGALEALAAGCEVICVNVTRREFSPPLDGHSGIPVAHSAEELGIAIDRVLAGQRGVSPITALEPYIGPVDGESTGRTCAAIQELLQSGGIDAVGSATSVESGAGAEDVRCAR